MNSDELTSHDLTAALRLPSLAPHAQAAQQLLISHRYWLRRLDFHPAIDLEVNCGLICAWIDWTSASLLVDSLSAPPADAAVLRFACVLTGEGQASAQDDRWSLRVILRDLDEPHSSFVDIAVTAFVSACVGGRL